VSERASEWCESARVRACVCLCAGSAYHFCSLRRMEAVRQRKESQVIHLRLVSMFWFAVVLHPKVACVTFFHCLCKEVVSLC
jgi:hypothetical protein